MANEVQVIRDFYGRIVGKVYTKPNGDQEARDFYGRCVGKYVKKYNYTTDFYGRIIAKGNSIIQTLYNNEYTTKK